MSEEHPCDDCIHYEKSWGACSLEPFILDDGYNLVNLPKWKPKYKGRECPNFTEKVDGEIRVLTPNGKVERVR